MTEIDQVQYKEHLKRTEIINPASISIFFGKKTRVLNGKPQCFEKTVVSQGDGCQKITDEILERPVFSLDYFLSADVAVQAHENITAGLTNMLRKFNWLLIHGAAKIKLLFQLLENLF
jgi:hypothetical protein